MSAQKQALTQLFVSMLMLWLIHSFSLQAAAGGSSRYERTSTSVTQPESESEKASCSWIDSILGPIIKYSPMDESVPYTLLPDTLETWKNFKRNMQEKYGTCIGITLDDHHQQILNGPGARRGKNLFWWNLTVKQDIWEDGKLICKVRGSSIDGGDPPHGITPRAGSQLNVDWASYETEMLYVANLYLEQRLLDDKLLLAIGKFTYPSYFDENKVAGWDFFSHSLARNQIFPNKYHTMGILGRYDCTDRLYVQACIADAEGIRSETGLNTAFHGEDYFITLGEVGIKTTNSEGYEGNYRFNLWYDPQPLTRNDGKGSERDTVGFGLNFDQALSEKTGAFLCYGWDDGRVRKFSNYWSLGGTYKGPVPDRDKDVLGFGVGQGITHQDYRNANNAAHTEAILETYYKIHVNEWCSVTLDLQVLIDPGLNNANDTSVIPGVRVKMAL